MNKNRDKGLRFERETAIKFREAGWTGCQTSRSESKSMDDSGVDLMFIPVNVQCKNVEKLGSVHKILDSMPQDKPPVVFHKRTRQGIIVCITEDFFFELLKKDLFVPEGSYGKLPTGLRL